MVGTSAKRLAELLCCTVELLTLANTTQATPAGSNDVGATGKVRRALLAEAEDTTRLAGETIHRYTWQCDPRQEPYALTRTYGYVRGRGNPGPYREDALLMQLLRYFL